MSGILSEEHEEEITGINVTPLVDVMLVLLVIFMVTTSYIVKNAIDLKLPKAASGIEKEVNTMEIIIDKEQRLYFNSQSIVFEDLPAIIAAEKQKATGENITVLISADEATLHGAVVRLIDIVRSQGITDFAINVEASQQK